MRPALLFRLQALSPAIARRRENDYCADRIRAELAFARSRGVRGPAALARHINACGFLTRDGRHWTAEAVERQTRRPLQADLHGPAEGDRD